MATNEEVGRRIREARRERGLSQGDLARLLVPPRTHAAVSDIERGKTHLDIEDLAVFARLLGKGLAYFYEGHETPRQRQPSVDSTIEAFKQVARQRATMGRP